MKSFKAPKWFILASSLAIGLIATIISICRTLDGTCDCGGSCYVIIAIAVAIPLLYCVASEESEDTIGK